MKKHCSIRFLSVLAPLALVACSLSGPLREDRRATGYKIGQLPSAWEKRTESEVDQTYFHQTHGSVLALSTVCNRYEDVPLDALHKDLINPIEARETILDERRPMDDREAAFTKIRGKLDGVPVEAYFVTLRKDGCIFDFSLFAKKQIPADDEKDFLKFVGSFHFSDSSFKENASQ
ncbi:MAG: hypothetical protein JST16_14845 [Bdellovibrionales bacterium]|nr:hypothetical protein [Bdellovibrionales bacterium]